MAAQIEDDDDCVVREIDVYVCNESVGAQLCLLAHPLRPPWRPYDYDRVKTMRFKPQAKRIEVDLPLDTNSANYNNEEESADASSSYKRVNQVTLRSTLVEAKTALAMGTLQDGKLLLAPLDYCIQMRPSLQYLNVSKKGKDADDDDDDDEDGEKEPTMRAVEVQVQKRETERQQQARLNSYAYISQQEEDEPWKVLTLHQEESGPAERVWNRIMAPAVDKPPLQHMDRATYLQAFIPSSGNMGQSADEWSREAAAPATGTADSISEEARTAFPTALKALFAKHTVCTIANVRTWLADAKAGAGAAREAATLTDRALHEMVLGSGVPVVCIRRMYILKQTGKPDVDPFRKVVIELLLDKEGFKRAEVTEAANSQGIAVTDSLYNKVVKDICQSRGQLWTLKNGADGL